MTQERSTDPARRARALVFLALGLAAPAWTSAAATLTGPALGHAPGDAPATTSLDSAPGIVVPCLRNVGRDPATTQDTTDGDCGESAPRAPRFSLEMGRQLHAGNGVVGRVDGLLVEYDLGSGISMNAVAGFPSASSDEQVNADQQLFGISADTMRLAGNLELSGYLIEERDQGRSTSRSLGAVMRFLRPSRSTVISLDYDAAVSALSTFMISGAWKPLPATTVSATFDISKRHGHRGSEEGFLQQTLGSTPGWRWAVPVEHIRSLSEDDSTDVTSAGLGLSHGLSPRLKVEGDIALLSVATDGAAADSRGPRRSNEYHHYLTLTGRDLVLAGDHGTVSLRHSIEQTSQSSAAVLEARYPIDRNWQLHPRLQADYYRNDQESSAELGISPAIKVEYRWDEDHGLDIETGGTWTRETQPANDHQDTIYFLTLGYRAHF